MKKGKEEEKKPKKKRLQMLSFICCAFSTSNMKAGLFLKLSPGLFKSYGEFVLIITCRKKQFSLSKNTRSHGF